MEVLSANAPLIIPVVVLLLAGAGFLLKRWISGQKHVEDHESLERAVKLKVLLKQEGMTLEDAERARDEFRRGSGGLLGAEARAVVAKRLEAEDAAEAEDPQLSRDEPDWSGPVPFEHTTAGMAIKAGAELDGLEGQLSYAIADLAHDLSEARSMKLYEAQDAWKAYRLAEAQFAGLLWEGGTGAKLLHLGRMIQLTEERIKDIALAKAESDL